MGSKNNLGGSPASSKSNADTVGQDVKRWFVENDTTLSGNARIGKVLLDDLEENPEKNSSTAARRSI